MTSEAVAPFRVPNEFTARRYQRRFMRHLDNGGKRALWVVHRRGGKDLTSLHQTCKLALERRGAYWHVFPTLEQGRKAIWEGFTRDGHRLMEQVFPKQTRRLPREFLPGSEPVVELRNGSLWRLMGSDKIEVVGAGPCGVVFSEFALAKPRTWDLVRPMLRENEGWAAFITTPRGRNHAHTLHQMAKASPDWWTETQTIYDTLALGDPEKLIQEERRSGMPEALIRQEYLCDWTAALTGSVYGDLLEQLETQGRVAGELEASGPVFTSWDLGLSDATAIWVWCVDGSEARLLDYHEAHGKPLSYYWDWLDSRGWAAQTHWLPHDAAAHTLASTVSIQEQFAHRFGRGRVSIGPRLSLLDGIQAGRWLMQRGLHIHSRCTDGLEALRAYRYEYDEDKKDYGRKPLHDWASHGADAYRGVAVVARVVEGLLKPEPKPPKAPPARPASSLSLDELWECR